MEKRPDKPCSLNLRYIMDKPPRTPFPWLFCICCLLLSVFIGTGIFMIVDKRRKQTFIIHNVITGDSLRDLACHYYNNPKAWKKIFLANRQNLMNRTTLIVGEKLVIPVPRKK